jgi:hypothetical protein
MLKSAVDRRCLPGIQPSKSTLALHPAYKLITDTAWKLITDTAWKLITDTAWKLITDAAWKLITDAAWKLITDTLCNKGTALAGPIKVVE